MAIDLKDIEAADMESAENALATLFEGAGIDHAEGSAVRELLIRPMAAMQAWQAARFEEMLAGMDIGAVARGEIPGDDSLLDKVAATYRVARRSGAVSSGTLVLYLRANRATYVNGAFVFYAGSHPLTLDHVVAGVPDPSAHDQAGDIRYTPILQADGEHYMVVPVTDPAGGTFPTGTAVTFTGSADNITRVRVLSPITGGMGVEGNRSLATRVLQGLAPGVLSTPTQIKGAFMDKFGVHPSRVRVFGSGERAVRRAVDPVTLLPMQGYTDVVVAPAGGPVVDTLEATAARMGASLYRIDLPHTLAGGVYTIDMVTPVGSPAIPGTLMVEWGTAPGPHRLPDGRHTAYQTAAITVGIASSEASIPCSILVRRVRALEAMQAYLDNDTRRAPGQDTLVRAATPCVLSATLQVDAGDVPLATVQRAVVDGINNLPVGIGSVSAQDIMAALPAGVSLRFPIGLRGEFLLPGGPRVRSGAQGVLVAPDWPPSLGGITGGETVFCTDLDHVEVTTA